MASILLNLGSVYDGFSAVCTGSKDSDSPGYVSIQGEQGFMKIDSKPNIA